jgi:predicted nucleic-acid-binding protein
MEQAWMISLDTNVLIRYFTEDDPEQSRAAANIIQSLTVDAPAFIAEVVVIELTWVLEKRYKYNKEAIVSLLKQLLATEQFVIENAQPLITALLRYEKTNKAQFADAVIAVKSEAISAFPIYSFDKNARELGMKSPA